MDNRNYVDFCTRCFASSDSGSMGGAVGCGGCTNCSSTGTTVHIPLWAVEDIRDNASWVGNRYYTCEEDYKNNTELKLLRSKMYHFPARTATPLEDEPGMWEVRQETGPKTSSMVFVRAASKSEALDLAKTMLPYTDCKLT